MKTHWSNKVEEVDKYWRQCGLKYFRKDVNDLIEWLVTSKEQRILDVGFGSGLLYAYLKDELKKQYVGVDYTDECLEYCRKTFPNGDFRIADARHLPFGDGEFHLVVSLGVLMHNSEWVTILEELIRVSKKYVITNDAITYRKTQDRGVRGTNVPRILFNPSDLEKIMKQHGSVVWHESTDTKGQSGVLGTFLLVK